MMPRRASLWFSMFVFGVEAARGIPGEPMIGEGFQLEGRDVAAGGARRSVVAADALGQGCALLFGSLRGFALSLRLGSPQGFALSLLLGPEAGVCGSLRGPVKLLGLLELLAGFRPREKAAEGRMRDVVVGSEFPDRFSGRAAAKQLRVGNQSAESAVALHRCILPRRLAHHERTNAP
jgi:hypothetical protein